MGTRVTTEAKQIQKAVDLAILSKQAERDQNEFDALVRATRARLNAQHEAPIIRRADRRRTLAFIALMLIYALLALAYFGSR